VDGVDVCVFSTADQLNGHITTNANHSEFVALLHQLLHDDEPSHAKSFAERAELGFHRRTDVVDSLIAGCQPELHFYLIKPLASIVASYVGPIEPSLLALFRSCESQQQTRGHTCGAGTVFKMITTMRRGIGTTQFRF
jgi:hypothetical protein